MFDNATSHLIYAKDALQAANMNKGPGGQQPFLWPGWYKRSDRETITQNMYSVQHNSTIGQPTQIQKKIQAVLTEQGLWPHKDVQLACEKLKCTLCQAFSTCNICIKGTRCNLCKKAKDYSGECIKQRICDARAY